MMSIAASLTAPASGRFGLPAIIIIRPLP